MPDLEERVAKLERDSQTIPDILDLQARVNQSRFAAVFAEFDTIKRRLDGIEQQVQALPRVLAEMLSEREKRS